MKFGGEFGRSECQRGFRRRRLLGGFLNWVFLLFHDYCMKYLKKSLTISSFCYCLIVSFFIFECFWIFSFKFEFCVGGGVPEGFSEKEALERNWIVVSCSMIAVFEEEFDGFFFLLLFDCFFFIFECF